MVNIHRLKDLSFIRWALLSLLITLGSGLYASKSETENHEKVKAEYNAGEAIIEHIVDSYSWHIMDIGEHAIAIPLPVILIDEGDFYCFSSAHFEHGHAS